MNYQQQQEHQEALEVLDAFKKDREKEFLDNINIKYDLERYATLNEVMYELQKCYPYLELFKAMTLKDFKEYIEKRYPEISFQEDIIYYTMKSS